MWALFGTGTLLPGMKPTRHSFRCGQPLGPGVAHHGMRNLVHHAQAHVASPRGERLPAQVADHLSDAAYVVIPVASVPGRSALDHVKLVDIFLGRRLCGSHTVEAYSKCGRTSDW